MIFNASRVSCLSPEIPKPFVQKTGRNWRLPGNVMAFRDGAPMPKTLEGSCRCGAVRFSVESHAPYPYQLCYCSICRKTAGGGGFAINLSAETKTLKIK